MKKYLPGSNKGFTLVELLVVIAIIAILATIGLTVFSGVQKNARDARRRGEIDAIAKALEANKTINAATYNVLANNQFQSGAVPVDTTAAKYCAAVSTTSTTPAAPSSWNATDACPAAYNVVSTTNPAATTVSWTVCALLENGTGTPPVYCKSNQQ